MVSSMLSIAHTLTGAFIASKVPDPLVYTPLTLASHYLEDWIPHRDVGTGLSTGRRKPSTAFLFTLTPERQLSVARANLSTQSAPRVQRA